MCFMPLYVRQPPWPPWPPWQPWPSGCAAAVPPVPGCICSASMKPWPQRRSLSGVPGGATTPQTRSCGSSSFCGICSGGSVAASACASTSKTTSVWLEKTTSRWFLCAQKPRAVGSPWPLPTGTCAWCSRLSRLKTCTAPETSAEANHSHAPARCETAAACSERRATTADRATSTTRTWCVDQEASAKRLLPQKSSARAGVSRTSRGNPRSRRTSSSSRLMWKSREPEASLAAKSAPLGASAEAQMCWPSSALLRAMRSTSSLSSSAGASGSPASSRLGCFRYQSSRCSSRWQSRRRLP
mmetsp:Transcript_12772/g.40054  ORF Transcript_12772/g.40054 Transcript_12772/m.40054 type:complete len:299 (+) Transcript_12772:331-1227(+)